MCSNILDTCILNYTAKSYIAVIGNEIDCNTLKYNMYISPLYNIIHCNVAHNIKMSYNAIHFDVARYNIER